MLKATFCAFHKVGEFGELVPTLLLAHTLDLQVFYFKMTMGYNSKQILWKENDFNTLTKLWCKVFGFPILNHKFHNSLKLLKL